jgi:hypothetical protein
VLSEQPAFLACTAPLIHLLNGVYTHAGFGDAVVLIASFPSEHFSGLLQTAPRIISLVHRWNSGGGVRVAVALAGTGQRMAKGEINIFLKLKYWNFCAQQILNKFFFLYIYNFCKVWLCH